MSKPQRDQISAVSTLIEGRNTSFFGGSNFVFSILKPSGVFHLRHMSSTSPSSNTFTLMRLLEKRTEAENEIMKMYNTEKAE